MLGLSNNVDAHKVLEVVQSLPANTRAILAREMNLSGIDDGTAILIYYAPAIVSNARAAIEKAGTPALSRESL